MIADPLRGDGALEIDRLGNWRQKGPAAVAAFPAGRGGQ